MQRSTAYSVAKYTSWVAIVLNLLILVWTFMQDAEGGGFYLFIVFPFLALPWVLFLIVVWSSSRWQNYAKRILILFLVVSVIFVLFIVYMFFANNSYNNNLEWITLVTSTVIIIETLCILFSNK